MCNDYEQHIAYAEYCKAMQALELGIPTQQTDLDLPHADDIKIGDMGPVMRAAGNGIELAQMKFGFPQEGKGPIFNFRSEGRSFANNKRCLMPASAFFEFTGKKYPKAKHRFTLAGEPFMAIAGLWRDGSGNQPPSFTMLTTSPGPDVIAYHNRQIIVLPPKAWADWIFLRRPESDLLRHLPAGSFDVENGSRRERLNSPRRIVAVLVNDAEPKRRFLQPGTSQRSRRPTAPHVSVRGLQGHVARPERSPRPATGTEGESDAAVVE